MDEQQTVSNGVAHVLRKRRERQWSAKIAELVEADRRLPSILQPRTLSTIRQKQMAAAKRANGTLFADGDPDETLRMLPVDAARDSARRQDTVCMRPLSKREHWVSGGAFLVAFDWLRMELAK